MARQYADAGLGQETPSADASTATPFTTPSSSAPTGSATAGSATTTNGLVPPRSLADVVGGMVHQSFLRSSAASGSDASQGQPAAGQTAVPTDPNSGLAPLSLHSSESIPTGYQAVGPADVASHFGTANLGTADHPAMRRAGHVWLPAVTSPELGLNIPGSWYSPRAAAEEQARRAIFLKRAERGLHNVGPGETVLDTDPASGRVAPVYSNPTQRTPTDEFSRVFLPAYARDRLHKSADALTYDELRGARADYESASQMPQRPSWDVTVAHDDSTGEDQLLRVDRTSGRVQRVVLPGGVAPGKGGKAGDDPQLPRAVQSYLLQLRTTYGSDLLGAEREITAAWPQLTASHPKLSADKAISALRRQFGSQAGASKFDELLNRVGIDPATLTRGAGAPGAPAAAPPNPSSAGAPAQVVPGQIVRLKSGARVTVRSVNPNGTFTYDPAPGP